MKQRRAPLIAGSVLFSILLWVFVKMGYDYQSTLTVPVVVEEVPAGLAVGSRVAARADLRLRGGGWMLAALGAGNPPAVRLRPEGPLLVKTASTVREALDLPAGVEVVGMVPETLTVTLEPSAARTVAVALDTSLRYGEGYGPVGVPVFDPPVVRVSGARSLLASIDTLRAAPASSEPLRAPFDAAVPVVVPAGARLTLDPPAVRLRVDVQALAEKVFTAVPVRTTGEPADRELILIPPRIDVTVRGGVGQLGELGSGRIEAAVAFDDVMADSTGTVAPRIILPPGLTLVAKRPERLEYVVRKRL